MLAKGQWPPIINTTRYDKKEAKFALTSFHYQFSMIVISGHYAALLAWTLINDQSQWRRQVAQLVLEEGGDLGQKRMEGMLPDSVGVTPTV